GEVTRTEEKRFGETLEKGMRIIEDYLEVNKAQGDRELMTPLVVDGGFLFNLYDTHGFPRDLAEEIFQDAGWQITDETRVTWEIAMEQQRTRGRESRSSRVVTVSTPTVTYTPRPSSFIGYDRLEAQSSVLAIYGDGTGKNEAVEGDEIELLTAETPFYGESGGQVGDRGT